MSDDHRVPRWAASSLKLKHIDLVEGRVNQDGGEVRTKFSKTLPTWFMPVRSEYLAYFESYVRFLREKLLLGLMILYSPKPNMVIDNSGGFQVQGL